MAFDYGSIDLGLKNPFRKEGTVTAVRGGILFLAGLYLLLQAVGSVKEDTYTGWILIIFGVVLLSSGIVVLSSGIYATLRYFVGRNHPTSLAVNFNSSAASTAVEEAEFVQYKQCELEEMLVGRKNITFVEPNDFLARLLHSIVPKLLFMPYPIRNMAQRIFGAWAKTITALVAFALVSLVTLAGFAGEAGKLTFPVYSVALMFYLVAVWSSAGRGIPRKVEQNIEPLASNIFLYVIVISIILPVIVGLGFSWLMAGTNIPASEINRWFALLPDLHTLLYLTGIIIAALLSTMVIVVMLKSRLAHANPIVEVSELRENWQESIHPNEIFINLDNLVMANRRYKEVPNRVYRELKPELDAQIEGKGSFKGELIQEIQPKVKPMNLGDKFNKARFISLISANILFVVSIVFIFLLAYSILDIHNFSAKVSLASLKRNLASANAATFFGLIMATIHYALISFIIISFAKLLANAAHLFYAEIQFDSLLVYFKCEGTFTESKISTGTGIHDSTRSENTLIRSSITPWIIVSRLVTTTFAATGMRNLEYPRYILEMDKSDNDLEAIKNDVIAFLKDRESIASITSVRDLENASHIHQLNQQTRAVPAAQRLDHDDEAAGYQRQEGDLSQPDPNPG